MKKKLKKVSQFRKQLKGGLFGIFQHPFCRETSEKMKAEPLRKIFCPKEVALCRNNEKNEKMLPKFFSKFFEVSGKSHSAEKCKKGDPLGFFERPFCCKISKKIEGRTDWRHFKKFAKKSLTKPKLHAQKNWPRARLEPTSFCFPDLKKS